MAPYRSVQIFEAVNSAPGLQSKGSFIKLGAYNIAHGRGGQLGVSNWTGNSEAEMLDHLAAIAKQVKEAEIDILVLNEVDFDATWSRRINQAKVIADEAGFDYHVEQRNMDVSLPFRRYSFGNAILSKYPIHKAEFVRFPALSKAEALFAGNHDGLLAEIKTPIGSINALACHLEYRSEDIRSQTARVIKELVSKSEIPFVAMGDFNSAPSFAQGHLKSSLNENAMDILTNSELLGFGLIDTDWGQYLTFPSEKPNRAIDWILTSPDLEQEDLTVTSSNLSDHLMITARIHPIMGKSTFIDQ